jgi:hypothetical protein
VHIEWLNETDESGQPYDIVLTLADGSTKYCEVKTRSFPRPVNQWFLSLNEVSAAQKLGDSYFAVLIWMARESGTRLTVREVSVVGFETGLSEAIREGERVKLIVQVNDLSGQQQVVEEEENDQVERK